jgi:hypothetical protein
MGTCTHVVSIASKKPYTSDMKRDHLLLFRFSVSMPRASSLTLTVHTFRQKISSDSEHCVIVHFDYGKENLDSLHELEKRLESDLADKTVGDYDGHEIATDYSDGFLYLYGDNAERLFKKVKRTLEATDFMTGAKVKLRFGPPEDGVKEIELRLGER